MVAGLGFIERGLALLPDNDDLLVMQDHLLSEQDKNQRAEQWLAQAREQHAVGDLAASQASVAQGLALRPKHAGLNAWQTQLQEQLVVATNTLPALEILDSAEQPIVAETPQKQIESLLASARRLLQMNRLTTPAKNNAYAVYRQILKLDPQNASARKGINSIANKYLQWARNNLRKGHLEKSLSHINKGLEVQPTHNALQRLHDEVLGRQAQEGASVQPPNTDAPPASYDPLHR